MSQAATLPRDHNNPPELLPVETVTAGVKEEHHELLKRIDDLIAKCKQAPETIEDEETQNKVADLLKAARKARTTAEAMRKIEIEPWDTRKKAVDAVFKKPSVELKGLEDKVREVLTKYTTEQADKARIEAERLAEEARQEEERLRKEAEAAEAKRLQAEKDRIEEERKAAEAAERRKQAEEDARKEKERAEQARLEAARIRKEQAEREAAEAVAAEQRRKEEEESRAQQVEQTLTETQKKSNDVPGIDFEYVEESRVL